ncbi:AAA family ATPase [Pseudanabaena sp. FACHB-2040]|uniref:AAA family ATPase n=1 Tax=Pseudanabaena sp. FACHB-2040 TaxID=2692859 RepID=UPI001682EEB8|nr:AAA family ATPase [Pseudanabaena sp. FACHB-2040]MBD2257627.1 AAA family ATPase [Pseudanabaena sp. FACHB-2040]
MSFAASVRHFQTLVLAFHPAIVIETVEEERVHTLITKACNELQISVFEWSVAQGLVRSQGNLHNRWQNEYAPPNTQRPQPIEQTADPLDMLRHIQSMSCRGIYWLKDFAEHLKDATVARQFREVADQFAYNQSTLVITGDDVALPASIAHDVIYFDVKLPEPDELYQTISEVVRSLKGKVKVELTPEDIHALVQAMQGMTLKQARKVIAYAALYDGKLNAEDIKRVLERKVRILHEEGLLDYFPPETNVAQLGGFEGLKQWLACAKVGFTPQAKAFNLPAPKGILIVGIQGCGKSLAAKTIAREWSLPLLKLDAGRLYDKYVGESEKNFRRAITLAETMAPCVLWIDEIEKSMGQSGSDADGGLSRRLFGYFLTWLQEKSQEIFVVATANDLAQLPSELLRKGRFDEIFFVDLPEAPERQSILHIHLTRHQQQPLRFDLAALVQATDGFSGAEIEQVIISAIYRAIYEKRPVDTTLIIDEVKRTVPLSVCRREDIQRLRTFAQSRFVSVK